MSELTFGQLVKIILGILVFVIVVIAVGYFFKDTVASFFGQFREPEPLNLFLGGFS